MQKLNGINDSLKNLVNAKSMGELSAKWERLPPTQKVKVAKLLIKLLFISFGVIWFLNSYSDYSNRAGKNSDIESNGSAASQTNSATSSANIAKPPTPTIDKRLYRVDSLILGVKYKSNPFEIRQKALGKQIEMQIYAGSFVDEGAKAKIIDSNAGMYCLMDGVEFGKNNKKGYIVVKGILAESGIRLGLNDCKFVSSDNEWKPVDDYDALIN